MCCPEYRRGRTLGGDEGVGAVIFLVVLVVAVAVIALVMRAAASPGGAGLRAPRRPRPQRPSRPLAPDDDPEFLRELERRSRRDDGSPA
jgi:hypothetical protein